MHRTAPLPRRAPAIAVALGLVGCASSPKDGDAARGGEAGSAPVAEPLVWHEGMNRDDRKLGFVLLEMDRNLRTWNELVIAGSSARDAHLVTRVEEAIAYDARKYFDGIVDQLLVGPPNNRRIAAAGLGFSGAQEALAPLLAALTDPDDEVVANALLSLGTLRDRDTPLTSIAALMTDSDTVNVRLNAGRALRALAGAGGDEEERAAVLSAARRAVTDPEPGVRTNAVLLLAQLDDFESLERIGELIYDEVPLVARASSRAVARLGSTEPERLGDAARILAAGLVRVDPKTVRPALLQDLQRLAEKNYGNDSQPWLEWANRLP